jgi:hypothetical protein
MRTEVWDDHFKGVRFLRSGEELKFIRQLCVLGALGGENNFRLGLGGEGKEFSPCPS